MSTKNDCPQCGQDMRLPPLSLKEFKALESQLFIAREALKDIEVLNNDAYGPKGSIEEAAKIAKKSLQKLSEGE